MCGKVVQELGRPIKYYRLNEDIKERVIIKAGDDPVETLKQRIAFLESAVAHLQMITNLAHESAYQRRRELAQEKGIEKSTERESKKKAPRQVCFIFLMLDNEGVRIWNQEYDRFIEQVEDRLQETQRTIKRST